ncbi:hypothetical protein KCV01_g11709, partial [Aureobasidium melanogenum]
MPVPPTKVTYYYTDPQGNVLAEADADGNITARYDYRPYGSLTTADQPEGPGYTGHVNDSDTGLTYMQARYYDSSTGRFLSTDPKSLALGDIYNFDRYGYANSNPVKFTDPDGLYACGPNTNKSSCAQIDSFVKTLDSSRKSLNNNSRAFRSLQAISRHIGKLGDNNGVILDAKTLSTSVIAQADSATLMTIDVKQATALSANYAKYNPGVSAAQLARSFGAMAIAHEGQHQLDYLNPAIGYPASKETEHRTEMNAYGAEANVAKGLGISTDLYAPGARQEDIDSRIKAGANDSTNYWCGANNAC